MVSIFTYGKENIFKGVTDKIFLFLEKTQCTILLMVTENHVLTISIQIMRLLCTTPPLIPSVFYEGNHTG